MLTTETLALPPSNLEAEESVLGAILLDPRCFGRIADILKPEAFYVKAHQLIFKAAAALYRQGQPTDLLTMTTWLTDKKQLDEVGGMSKLALLVDRTVSSVNIDRYAALIEDKWVRRQSINLGYRIVDQSYNTTVELKSILDDIKENVAELTHLTHQSEDDAIDHDYWRYKNMIDEIRKIELKITDPGFKKWKLQGLAKKYGRTTKELEQSYYLSLVHEENEQPTSFDELKAKYGGDLKQWLMHGFLPRGSTVLLHADGGVGKTRLAYNFFYHLATGTDWGRFTVTAPQRKCLIVQADEPASDMIPVLSDRGFNDSLPVLYKTRFLADHIPELRKEIEQHRPEVILIDSLTTINRSSTFSENDTEYARPVLLLRDLAQEFNCTILIIHHSNSEGNARGTRAIFNSVSEVWKLAKDPKNPAGLERLLTIEKSRSRRPGTYRLQFNPDDKSWEMLGQDCPEEQAASSLKSAIVNYLRENPNVEFEATEIHNAVGGSLQVIRRYCLELADDGEINRQRKGTDRGNPYLYSISYEQPEESNKDEELNQNYQYIGDDSSLQNLCIRKPYVRVLRVEKGLAEINAPGWKITHTVPLKDLQPIKT